MPILVHLICQSSAARRRLAFALLCVAPLGCAAQTAQTAQTSKSTDQFFDSAGVKIRYIVAGTGEPVVLIHPFAASLETWDPVIQDLSRNYRVIAMDCRGHGLPRPRHERQTARP